MALICIDCGNTEGFSREVRKNVEQFGVQRINNDEEDYSDVDIEDEDDYDVWDSVTEWRCDRCESEAVEEGLSENEIQDIQWKHTDKEGNWSEEELDEDERNVELGDEILTRDI